MNRFLIVLLIVFIWVFSTIAEDDLTEYETETNEQYDEMGYKILTEKEETEIKQLIQNAQKEKDIVKITSMLDKAQALAGMYRRDLFFEYGLDRERFCVLLDPFIQKKDNITNPADRIKFYKQIFELFTASQYNENSCDSTFGKNLLDEFVNYCVENKINLTKEYIDKILPFDRGDIVSRHWIDCIEIDINGDGKVESFYIAQWNGFATAEYSGITSYLPLVCGNNRAEVLKVYDVDKTKDKAVLISAISCGTACDYKYQLIRMQDGKLVETFRNPDSVSAEFKDIDNDGMEEIVCVACFGNEGKCRINIPQVYKWDGKNFIDYTLNLNNGELLISRYRKLWESLEKSAKRDITFAKMLKDNIDKIDEIIINRSEQYKEFWEKNLKPISEQHIEELKQNIPDMKF